MVVVSPPRSCFTMRAVIVVIAITIRPSYPALAPSQATKPIVMPIELGYATVTINDQPIQVALDSGSPVLSVLDKSWYEKRFGVGACEQYQAGCFSCPTCDFDTEPVTLQKFHDGAVLQGIRRYGSIHLGDRVIENFPFLVSRAIAWNAPDRPRALLGLSLAVQTKEESVIETLVQRRIISKKSYRFDTQPHPNTWHWPSGALTLGLSLEDRRCEVASFTFNPCDGAQAYPNTWLESISLLDASGKVISRTPHNCPESSSAFPVVFDTGAAAIVMPNTHLIDRIVKSITTALKRRGYRESETKEMYRMPASDELFVKSAIADYLPTLVFYVGREPSRMVPVRIPPSSYCRWTDEECEVMLLVSQAPEKYRTVAIFGAPFFYSHSLHVDFDTRKVGIINNLSCM